jgi:transposase InsO family protein
MRLVFFHYSECRGRQRNTGGRFSFLPVRKYRLRLFDRQGTEYCGSREHHEYQLYLSIEDIDHTKTKAKRPQANGICERFHRTIQRQSYAIAFRKKIYDSQEALQTDLQDWLNYYNIERSHGGRFCFGKTPM